MVNPQDNYQLPVEDNRGVPPPPRLLLWGIIGLFVLAVLGLVGGLFVFRNVLTTGQQVRIADSLPFMEAFIPIHPTPEGGVVPTAIPQTNSEISPESLLGPIGIPSTEPEETSAVDETEEPTNVAVLPTDTAVPQATASPTLEPTATVTLPPTATVEPQTASNTSQTSSSEAANVPLLPSRVQMFLRHEKQTWNNCGPANITMALSHYGWQDDQTVAAEFLKPGGREDKNVNPTEMVSFVNDHTGVRAISRIGGDLILLKSLLAREIPVIIETGYMPEGYDWMGHYQTVVGYDDGARMFYIYDSFLGTEAAPVITVSYDDMDSRWQHFNRTFIVVYEKTREPEIASILGDLADPTLAAERALAVAQAEATANPQNPFAWFNMGTALTKLTRYDEAAVAFDKARQLADLPFRILWYQFGPFEAYYNTGRYNDILSLATAYIENSSGNIEEIYYWQGLAYRELGMTQDASTALRRALNANPDYADAQTALASIG